MMIMLNWLENLVNVCLSVYLWFVCISSIVLVFVKLMLVGSNVIFFMVVISMVLGLILLSNILCIDIGSLLGF